MLIFELAVTPSSSEKLRTDKDANRSHQPAPAKHVGGRISPGGDGEQRQFRVVHEIALVMKGLGFLLGSTLLQRCNHRAGHGACSWGHATRTRIIYVVK